jgi:hypothetical protein
MGGVLTNYMTAEMEGEFVVFLTGMRINKFWKIWKWLPVFVLMPRMNRELARDPALGLLHYRNHLGLRNVMVVQYWRSFAHLHAYATNQGKLHVDGWRKMNRDIALSGDVGTWHETYIVRRGDYENLYVNMPPHGLGKAGSLSVPRGSQRTAKGRLGLKADATDLHDEPAP